MSRIRAPAPLGLGRYSTSDGFIGEVSVTESNFLGRGQFVRVAGSYGQRSQASTFVHGTVLGYRLAAGFDLFSKFSDQTKYARYENQVVGGQLRLGLPVTEEFGVTLRYSLYQNDLTIPNDFKQPYNDCTVPIPGFHRANPDGTPNKFSREGNGEASLAIKESAGKAPDLACGPHVQLQSLDSTKDPRNGFYGEVKTDFAGLGGDTRFFRATGDARYYYELFEDVVGIARVQGGHIVGLGGDDLRIVDHFFMGPSLVRGFASSGIGPRDISSLDSRSNAIGGTTYFGGTLEVQFPIFGLPRDLGLERRRVRRCGNAVRLQGRHGVRREPERIIEGFSTRGVARSAPRSSRSASWSATAATSARPSAPAF